MTTAVSKAGFRQNRWVRRGTWALAALLALWVVAWLAVPPLLKNQAEKSASELLGRKVTVGSVSFLPWTLELTVNDLAVATQDGRSAQLMLKRLYIDAELQSLLRLAPVVDAATVEGVSASLVHLGGGRYDVDDILARLAARPPADPQAEPTRFALYNLSLSAGQFDFTDKAVGKTQQLRDLRLSIPFLSTLASQREVRVEPRLAFLLNGSAFDSAAAATPFAQSRKTDASLKLSAFDLRPFVGYLPPGFPVKLQSAVLDADVLVAFEQVPRLAVRLSGTVRTTGVKLLDGKGADLLAFDSLTVGLEDVRPLERQAKLSLFELIHPRIDLSRDASGTTNLQALVPVPSVAKDTAQVPAKAGPAAEWAVAVAKIAVRGGKAAFSDSTVNPMASLLLRDLTVDASGLHWPLSQAMPFSGSVQLDGKQPASLGFSGMATARSATATLTVGELPLSAAAPYLSRYFQPALSGSLSGEFGLVWQAGADGPINLQLAAPRMALDKLALTQGGVPLGSVQKIEVEQARLDLRRQSLAVGRLAATQPRMAVERGEDGRWMYERWLKGSTGVAAAGEPGASGVKAETGAGARAAPDKAPKSVPAWSVDLADLSISGGNVQFQDKAGPRPVSLEVSALQVQAKNFSPAARSPSPLSVSARVGTGRTEPGKLVFKGALALAPLTVQGQVEAVDLPLHAAEPYFGDALNIELLRADASFKGRVAVVQAPAGLSVKLAGDAALEEFRASSVQVQAAPALRGQAVSPSGVPPVRGLQAAEELLAWRTLSLRGLDVALAPGAATLVNVRETVLSDFFARIIVNESGRINLQDVVKASVPAGTSSTMAATATAASVADSTAASTPPESDVPPVIRFGPVALLNGKVLFSDRFVKPNYSANLSELNGKLSAFSSVSPKGTPQLADLELRGRAEGTASLEVLGKLNPLAKPLALDIKGKVRDLELPPLSPYAIKYAGHGIERGKLSLDVAYVVRPDGQLTASNRLLLNQLSFGEPVPGAAASLPVKLAVALLADRNGMIDIDLPVSGSLNDPQFSLAPVIFKIILNVIAKALTAPFSLMAGAFGAGGDELSVVSFAPGSAVLGPEAQKGLDRVAKALADRPALKMTVVGTASLDVERDAWKREKLKQLVQAERRRESVAAGATDAGEASVSAAEYPVLLKEVYRRADIRKPRNMIGMAKDLPQAEMEELLLANVVVTDEAMRELAVRRGVVVRDYLAAQKLPLERLYLGAAKAVPPEAKWSPRAELNLAAQ